LGLDRGSVLAVFLGFRLDDAKRLSINEKHVISRPDVRLIFANRDTERRVQIYRFLVLCVPACPP
jgi:hypothetical protein